MHEPLKVAERGPHLMRWWWDEGGVGVGEAEWSSANPVLALAKLAG